MKKGLYQKAQLECIEDMNFFTILISIEYLIKSLMFFMKVAKFINFMMKKFKIFVKFCL
jgi:hypothetical protein